MLLHCRSACHRRLWTGRVHVDVLRNEAATVSECLELWKSAFSPGSKADPLLHRHFILDGFVMRLRQCQGGKTR